MVLEIFISVLLGILVLWFITDRIKYHGYSPGPFRFPLVGNIPQLAFKSRLPSKAMRELASEYGDVMFVRMGMIDFVVFSSHSALMELFALDGVSCNRKAFQYMTDRGLGDADVGVVMSNGSTWNCLRRFTIRSLREFGFGKSSSMSAVITEEAYKFVKHFKGVLQKSSDASGIIEVKPNLFDASTLNVIWRLVTSNSYELDDEKVLRMLKLSNDYVRSARVDDISICYPILRTLFPKWSGKTLQEECIRNLLDFLDEAVKEHERSGDYLDEPKCFIDVFLQMIQKEKHSQDSNFTRRQLLFTLLDLFQAGSETTSKTLTFALIHMVRNPEKQERVQQEIDAALNLCGEDETSLTTEMKTKLVYTTAVIYEMLRISDVIPIPGPYESEKDFTFRGHKIEKGTPLMANLEAVHFQESIWGGPNMFRPERFVDSESGELNPKLLENIMPFGKGKRVCLGQSLAEATLFLFFTTVMRHFHFEKVEGESSPSLEAVVGLAFSPKPFRVKVTARY